MTDSITLDEVADLTKRQVIELAPEREINLPLNEKAEAALHCALIEALKVYKK